MKNIKIANRNIGKGEPVYVIAEAGINHEGDIETAKKLIRIAKDAGADAIKFQTHLPEKEMLNDLNIKIGDITLFELLKKVELTKDNHIKLKEYATRKGIEFLSTPFCKEAVDLLEEIDIPAYKVGSGEMTNFPLLEYIAKKKKPMIISTGMNTYEEIDETIVFLKKFKSEIILLHCTSDYPTKYEDVNLRVIKKLQEKFEIPIGLSDHSIGIYTALASVPLGACVIEKHFTSDKNLLGPDHKISLNPTELKKLVEGIRIVEKAMGSIKELTDNEIAIRKIAHESIVSLMDIPKETIIKRNMIGMKRPGTGIPSKDFDRLIGLKTIRNIKANTIIKWSDFE